MILTIIKIIIIMIIIIVTLLIIIILLIIIKIITRVPSCKFTIERSLMHCPTRGD